MKLAQPQIPPKKKNRSSEGVAEGGFAQRKFELRPKNTAKFYIQRN